MRKFLLVAALVLVILLVLASAFVVFSYTASAHTKQTTNVATATYATQCKDVNPQVKWSKPVITFFSVHICYDGSHVWTTRVDCNLFAFAGTAFNTWCGTSVNNSSYVEFGNNYTFVPWGSWFQIFGYNRFQYDANGNFIRVYGN